MPPIALQSITELPAATDLLLADLFARGPIGTCGVLELDTTLLVALMAEHLSPEDAVTVVVSFLAHQVTGGDLKEQTVGKAGRLITSFVRFQRARRRVDDVTEIGRSDVLAFLHAPVLGRELGAPTDQTWDNRRWALDTYFRTLRELGCYDGDPLLDVPRRGRTGVAYRPLTAGEITRCRLFAGRTRRDTRGPAAWALAEATATTSEISRVVVADVDLDHGRVWLTGGARNIARWGLLTDWGHGPLARRLASLDERPHMPVIYEGRGNAESQQASACDAVSETLARSGLGPDRTARPLSVPAWRGRMIYDATGDIVEVAHRLGLRSLDDARRIVDVACGRCDVPPAHRVPGR